MRRYRLKIEIVVEADGDGHPDDFLEKKLDVVQGLVYEAFRRDFRLYASPSSFILTPVEDSDVSNAGK